MKSFVIAVLCIAFVGCAAPQSKPIDAEMLSSLDGKSLTLVQRESPTFIAMTSGKGGFALLGVGAAAAAGNKMVKEKQIEDPAMSISQSVAQSLTEKHGLLLQGASAQAAGSNDLDDIVEIAQGSDYALDVATTGWQYIYDGFKFGDYFVNYASQLRLIDVDSAQVVSSGSCGYNGKQAGKSPVSHDELLENDAAFIKQELAEATQFCIDQFRKELFQG